MSIKKTEDCKVLITTMDRFPDIPNTSTMYSVIWLVDDPNSMLPNYLDSTIGYCGSDVVKNVAEGIVANTDEVMDDLFKYLDEIEKTINENQR